MVSNDVMVTDTAMVIDVMVTGMAMLIDIHVVDILHKIKLV